MEGEREMELCVQLWKTGRALFLLFKSKGTALVVFRCAIRMAIN